MRLTAITDKHLNTATYTYMITTTISHSLSTLLLLKVYFRFLFIRVLRTVTQQTVRQTGTVDLTLEFDLFPYKRFDHKFLIADVYHPLLGLDFLQKHKFVINTVQHTVTLDEVPISKITKQFEPDLNYDKVSYQDIIALYPSVTSGEMN